MMPRIRTLIVDDEPAAREAVASLLSADSEVSVLGAVGDGRSALEAIRTDGPELLLLDIQMPEMDGFALLRELAPAQMPVVVFVTAWDQHALRAFEFHALDYLLKPFDDVRFHEVMARAKERVRLGRLGALSQQIRALLDASSAPAGGPAPYLQRLVIKGDGRSAIVSVDEIVWIDADGDHVRIHTLRAVHQLRETMAKLERQLDPECFVRIHRSTIVRVDRVKELQPYFRGEHVVILQDGTSLKLSRGYRSHLEAALGRPL